ncbi:MAG: hypothetical protein IJE89_05110 [Bacilli bacterium]|nr:hypothetical protein [Bacilli bacterium]
MSDTRKNRYNIENIHARHASYVKMKSEIGNKDRNDTQIMTLGQVWYNMGHTLEEAEEELRNDTNFVKGYERAARLDKINDELYQLGKEFFLKGIPLGEIPSKYRDNEWFVNGYNAAIKASLQKKNSRL